MTYFRLKTAHYRWLEEEIQKGTIFYKTSRYGFVPCGSYRQDGFSYDALTAGQVSRMLSRKSQQVYWRNW